ncbi:MAG: hypothetical protein C5B58_01395 [Acidobacteria bacterium]|nr:MAG: hypothetical protein C5B58_01395 [Acidobacteriota bacterium]
MAEEAKRTPPYRPGSEYELFVWLSDFYAELDRRVLADCRDWEIAVGYRRKSLTRRELLLLQAWRWDQRKHPPIVDWVRSKPIRRSYPNKSPKQDIPWPVRVTQDEHGLWRPAKSSPPPKKWSPRRWFGPGQSAPPLQISTTGAQSSRDRLDAEYEAAAFCYSPGVALDHRGLPKRKHPNPGGFWGPERGWWGPETEPGRSLLGGPHPAEYCHEIDEAPPKSVLLQTHEPPAPVLPVVDRFRLVRGVRRNDYWRGVKDRPIGRWGAPQITEIARSSPPRLLPPRLAPSKNHGEWWKQNAKPRYRYWDQHILAVYHEGRQWPTKPQRRPHDAPHTLDLIWRETPPGPIKIFVPPYCVWPVTGGPHVGKQPFFPWVCHVADCPSFDQYPRRVLVEERLRSPFLSRGFEPLWRPKRALNAGLHPPQRGNPENGLATTLKLPLTTYGLGASELCSWAVRCCGVMTQTTGGSVHGN